MKKLRNLKCKAQEHLSSPWARPKPKYFFSFFFPPNREYKLVPAAQYLRTRAEQQRRQQQQGMERELSESFGSYYPRGY